MRFLALVSVLLMAGCGADPESVEPTSQTSQELGVLPPAWSAADVTVGGSNAGSTTYSNGTFTVTGFGKGVRRGSDTDPDDQMRFVFRQVSGDIEVVARLTSLTVTGSGAGAQVGVALRTGTGATDLMGAGFLTVLGCEGCVPQAHDFLVTRRSAWEGATTTKGGVPASTRLNPIGPAGTPIWFRLQRVGNDFSFSRRAEGSPYWVPASDSGGEFMLGQAPVDVGFFVSGGNGTTPATATFDNVYVGPPRLAHRTSWIGSNANQVSSYIGATLNSLYVAPGGTILRNGFIGEPGYSIFSPFDPSGNLIPYDPAKEAGGLTGAPQGALTGSGTSVFFARGVAALGRSCVQERSLSLAVTRDCPTGAPTFQKIGGMAVSGTNLFVTEPDPDGNPATADARVSVLNTSDLLLRSSVPTFSVPARPGPIAADGTGAVWIAHTATDYPNIGNLDIVATPSIKNYTNTGTDTGRIIQACDGNDPMDTVNCVRNPSALAYNPATNELLVAENGIEQAIRRFSLPAPPAQPMQSMGAWIGNVGGIYGIDANPTRGRVSDPANGGIARLYNIVGIGVDQQQPPRVYAASGAVGTDIRGLNVGSTFRRHGLLNLVNSVDFDPLTDGQNAYSARHRFSVSPGVVFTGLDSQFEALTWDAFPPLGYVELNEHFKRARRSGQPIVREINGQRFLYVWGDLDDDPDDACPQCNPPRPVDGPQGAKNWLSIYRFQGEIAIPCGAITSEILCGPNGSCDVDPNPNGGSVDDIHVVKVWVDYSATGAANGSVNPGEETSTVDPLSVVPCSESSSPPTCPVPESSGLIPSAAMIANRPGATIRSFDVDHAGNIWLLFDPMGEPNYNKSSGTAIWQLKRLGMTPDGLSPDYIVNRTNPPAGQLNADRRFFIPPTDFQKATRLRYDSGSDTMYLLGVNGVEVVLAAYPNWSSIGSAASPNTPPGSPTPPAPVLPARFVRNLPRHDNSSDFVNDGAYTAESQGVTADVLYQSMNWHGDKLFLEDFFGPVHVFEATDGSRTTTLATGPEASGWMIPGASAARAFRRSNGEYLVSIMENSGRAANHLFRWKPGTCVSRIGCGPDDACRGLWRADEGSGTQLINESGHTNGTATLSAGATFVPAWEGFGLHLPTGAEYAEVPHTGAPSIQGAITLAAWVKPLENNRVQYILKKARLNNTDGYELGLDSDGRAFVRFNQFTRGDTFKVKGGVAIPVGAWTHIAATSDRASARLYVNGAQVASKNLYQTNNNAHLDIAHNSLRLGLGAECRFNGSCSPDAATRFKGTLDEMRLFARALPPESIAVLARRGPAGQYWFEEGSGTAVADVSGACNGMMVNGATFVSDPVKGGNALSFDGNDDYAEVSGGADLGASKSFTLAAWVRPSAFGRTLLAKTVAGTPTTGYELSITSTGRPSARVNNVSVVGPTALQSGALVKLAAVYDGTQLRLYLGNTVGGPVTLIGSAPVPNVNVSSTLPLGVGAKSDGSSRFAGTLDDVFYYRRALSANQLGF